MQQTPQSVNSATDPADLVRTALREFTDSRGIQAAFNDFMVHNSTYTEYLFTNTHDELKKILMRHQNSADLVDFTVKQIIYVTAHQSNDESIVILLRILEKLVTTSIVPARLTCESLLECEKLVYRNSTFWNTSFSLIRKIISHVDYKGVREIMKICLEKLITFPYNLPNSALPQLNVIVQLLEHIFDRDACLLPAYFIVNEILKSYPENRHYPHWTVSKLLSDFVDTFKYTAQIVTIIGRSKMLPVVENSGHPGYLLHSWKLDQSTLRFVLKGNLPYDKELLQPQDKLLRYVLEQPYSRDMVCAILGLQKQHKVRCIALEERLVELIVLAMEKTETEMNPPISEMELEEISSCTLWLWQHLATQVIFFVLFQFASFPHIVMMLHEKLMNLKVFKGKDFLMWILLQFISGSIQKNPLSDFLPVLSLFDLLYPEKEPLEVPDVTRPFCTAQMAATCIWIHVLKKAQTDNVSLPRPLPTALKKHYDFLQIHVQQPNSTGHPPLQITSDFRVPLLCNAFSTNQEYFSRPMAALVETLHQEGNATNQTSSPLSVQVLDSLTVHTKMSLIHNIVTSIMKVAQSKSSTAAAVGLSPALIETYARLLVYMEIESLGIKGFISQLLPAVYKSQAWGILHTLLEMFCYRLHHIQPHYRLQLLAHLNSLATTAQANVVVQLHLCVEMTALRLITGFQSVDIHSQLSRVVLEYKTLVSADSEELNRALVLTIARAVHMTGSSAGGTGTGASTWFRDILNAIMQHTPHNWSSHTLQCFPPLLGEYFQQNQVPKENKQHLRSMVEDELKNWNAMQANEQELIEHFSMQGTPPLFLCIIWKTILETGRVPPAAYKILERIGPKGLSGHLRKFCDYIVGEFANAGAGQHVNKLADAITDLIWKYNFVAFDRLLLCMALRSHEGNEAQVCFFVIQVLMVKPPEFRNRIQEFLKDNSPEHWKHLNWHEKHKTFNSKFPEVFNPAQASEEQQLPVYFGNICLRFLPVFDIIIHRFLEINAIGKHLEMILEHMGCIYKFHDRPITYLYNTLHYYESRLQDKPYLKKKLVGTILGSLKDVKPQGWALSEQYHTYLGSSGDEISWSPDIDYYCGLTSRFVDVIEGKRRLFTDVDWRYNEFPNPAAHVLHSTCVELMALPVLPAVAGSAILDVVMQGQAVMETYGQGVDSCKDLEAWFNATGLILVSLPDPYWLILHDRLASTIENLSQWSFRHSPLILFNFKAVQNGYLYNEYANLLAVTHAVWHHLGTGHIHHILTLVTERFQPLVKNEIQLLFIAHLIGPFLQRLNSEKPQVVCRLTIAFYELLEQIDQATTTELHYMDIFCDLLYHIKYMFTGDIVKSEVEAKIRNFRPTLQMRLRFITHLNIEGITMNTGSSTPVGGGASALLQPQITTSFAPGN